MKKENIFDLYAAQHKDDPAQAAERVPGEVRPEDVTPPQEATQEPEPKQDTTPETPKEPEQAPAATPEEGNNDGV